MMSMEKKHKCKLCSRKFSSGKAMGGHMRSHLRTLPLPPKTPPQKQGSSAGGGGRSESTLSLHDGSVVVHDGESETESTKKPIRMRRSKRTRRTLNPEEVLVKKEKLSGEFEPVSSFSDTSPEEDIAICLMMLSKDDWGRRTSSFKCYKCEICNKVLKSSQALGSHKTIHKKNVSSSIDEQKSSKEKSRLKNVDRHECPFCGKMYESGQALGGHKRSHILSSSTTASSSSKAGESLIMESTSAKFPNGLIDLNMPAPMEDEDFSQLEVSAVS